MLVVLMNEQLLQPHHICQNCLLANQSGQPRWHGGQLRCGHLIHRPDQRQPEQYECQMGFRIVNIE